MPEDNILAELEAKDKLYRCEPFVAQGGGSGVNLYNVPFYTVRELVQAFTRLFMAVPVVKVYSKTVEEKYKRVGVKLTQPVKATTTAFTTAFTEVVIDNETFHIAPSFGIWERVELTLPTKGDNDG